MRLFPLVIGVLLLGGSAYGQMVDDFNPSRANCCLAMTAKNLADQLQDWNQLGRYHRANEELKKRPFDSKRVVFMGDSITDGWKLNDQFPGQPYVNRGIGGQTTPQMLVRLYPDVISLKPGAMVLLAGTNDVARNTGPMTAEMIEQNIMAMTELAQNHGIKVILCSVLPVSDYPFLKQQSEQPPASPGQPQRFKMTDGRPPSDILKLNAWIKDYAARVNAIYVDYFTAMVDEKGWLRNGYSADGLHPNAEGYKVMAPIVVEAIEKAFK
jgi:lysophospholipase L1-like esterase